MRNRLVVVLVFALLLPLVARADTRSFRDPNDARGPLDIRRVTHGHQKKGGDSFFVHTVSTHKRWGSKLLGRDATEIDLWFSTDGDGRPDRVVYINHDDGRLRASMNTYENEGDSSTVGFIGNVKVRRVGGRGVRVWLPVEWMSNNELDDYNWFVFSFYTADEGSHCREDYSCFDRAPNEESIVHSLS